MFYIDMYICGRGYLKNKEAYLHSDQFCFRFDKDFPKKSFLSFFFTENRLPVNI